MSAVFKMCVKKDRDQMWKMSAENGSYEHAEESFTTLTVLVIAMDSCNNNEANR